MVHFYFHPDPKIVEKLEKQHEIVEQFRVEDREDKIIEDFCIKIDSLLNQAVIDNQLAYILYKVFE